MRSVATIVVILFLVGCSFAPDAAEDTIVFSPTTVAQQRITISFGASPFERQAIEPLLRDFMQIYPDIRVQFVEVDASISDVSSLVDVALTNTTEPATLSSTTLDTLLDLQPLMDADASFAQDDVVPEAFFTHGDRLVGVARSVEIPILLATTARLNAYSLPITETWTVADVQNAAEMLMGDKREDHAPSYGFADPSGNLDMFIGHALLASDMQHRSPEALQGIDQLGNALTSLRTLVQNHVIYQAPAAEAETTHDLIASEQVAIWTASRRALPNSMHVTALPYPRDAPSPRRGDYYVISAGTTQPQAAWQLLSFLSRAHVPSPIASPVPSIPARAQARTAAFWESLDTPFMTNRRRVVQDALARREPSSTMIDPLLLQATRDVFFSQTDPSRLQALLTENLSEAIARSTPVPSSPMVVVPTVSSRPPDGGRTAITFGFYDGMVNRRALDLLQQRFEEKHPDIAVDIVPFAPDGTKPYAELLGSVDSFLVGEPASRDKDLFLDLRPLADTDATFTWDDYAPGIIQQVSEGGKLLVLPNSVRYRTLFYNPALFEERGIPRPTATWTREDFLNAAAQLTFRAGKDDYYGFASVGWMPDDITYFLRLWDAEPVGGSPDAVVPTYTTEQMETAVREIIALYKDFSPNTAVTGYRAQLPEESSVAKLVTQGRVGMWFDDTIDSSASRWQSAPPFPQHIDDDDIAISGLGISATSDQQEASWRWIRYVSTETTYYLDDSEVPALQALLISGGAQQNGSGRSDVAIAYQRALERPAATVGPQLAPLSPELDAYWLFEAMNEGFADKPLAASLREAQRRTEAYTGCYQTRYTWAACARTIDSTYDGQAALLEQLLQ